METSDAHGNLFYSKGDRFHMCFTRWCALKLVKNERALMFDIDLGTEEYSHESSEFPVLATIKQEVTSQKRGTKMKDRYFCLVLLVGQAHWGALPGKDDDVADHPFESHNPVYQIMSVIMESIRPFSSDCRERGNARKDCSKFSAWLVGCKRRKLERASDTGKLNCAPNQLGGQGSATTGGAIDSGVSPRMHRGIQNRGNACQSLSTWRFNFLDRLSPPILVSDRTVHRLHHRNDGSR